MKKLHNKPNKEEMDAFEKIIMEMLAQKKSKAGDYGNTWKVFGSQGINSEIGRKFSRFWLNKDKDKLNNELLRDTLIDMATYCIMRIAIMDEDGAEDQVLKLLKS